MKRWLYIALPCLLFAIMAGVIISHSNTHTRNTQYVPAERVELRSTSERPIAKEISRNNDATWVQLKAGKGIDTWLLTYDGRQYILVNSGQSMTMVEHKSP